MAADAVGLLDTLGIKRAHVVGASLGGQIGQTMAIERSDRVCSLTSMMSTTGNMSVGQPSPEVVREVFTGRRGVTRDEVIQQTVRALRAVGSPGYPSDENEIAARGGGRTTAAMIRSVSLVRRSRRPHRVIGAS